MYRNELPFILKSFKKALQSLPAMFDSMTRSRSTSEKKMDVHWLIENWESAAQLGSRCTKGRGETKTKN